ncbi:hypothetical protein BATDEDRAFT_33781 [Batrachochytrium dendrobatidis JAM81]|uniref:Flavoprotein domain-containing protein n=1 Tax=Batrachochytrium dendrobatidis (strain JAM81 / FGSC 10211) TaxID=684364 RepID=F4PCU2_BATDJ|nr:uncharacterized protein BATDEDRAFT_33781 [Batrachochytrium dendrobatidis JAM81]EGF77003.1 hypothetical protein BATDEDRAFT_33781 [Batrachochytrium dendrobatidis JAM81]KAJ8330903.1 hypothetical protein O5D80_000921 [Batrachochytrium dendrobatidis]KAK5672520.1 hypothetical protein QVD99_001280 [Batrachochytrium dendrobatidis]|eukprot:XP_006682439.1 hypothetical protein BATDEDRAFT_33781 [Batrachochytrium dendrobatidis JAM81]
MHILVGVTGSVATIKLPLLIKQLKESFPTNLEIKIIATHASQHFINTHEIGSISVLTDKDEWDAWKKIPDPVLHIDLRNWADLFIIAPLDANTMAKAVHGLCDNLLTCVLRAWDSSKPVVVCPAMNTHMWSHPITSKQLTVLSQELGYVIVHPISKQLACGDVGIGAMADVSDIVAVALKTLNGQ